MKLKDLIKELELYDKELQVIVQSQPLIMVDIGSFDKKTVVHIFSLDEQKLKAHMQEDIKTSGAERRKFLHTMMKGFVP